MLMFIMSYHFSLNLFSSGDDLGTDSVKHVARLLLRFSSRVLLSCAFFVFFIYFLGACMRAPPLVPLPRGFLGRSCADPSCLALHRAPLSFSDLGSCLSSATFTLFSFFVSCSHFVTFRDSSHRSFGFCSAALVGPEFLLFHVDLVVNVGRPSVCKAQKVPFG